VRTKILINNNIIEKVNSFNYLGYLIRRQRLRYKSEIIESIGRTLNKKKKDTQIKLYKVMGVPTLTYGSEI
jgi:hypothetical protein